MSIYEGTNTEQSYAQGFNEGARCGEHDRRDVPVMIHHTIADVRDNARYGSRSYRAHLLGWLRGYRDAVRTFERGRWGT